MLRLLHALPINYGSSIHIPTWNGALFGRVDEVVQASPDAADGAVCDANCRRATKLTVYGAATAAESRVRVFRVQWAHQLYLRGKEHALFRLKNKVWRRRRLGTARSGVGFTMAARSYRG